MGGGGEGRKSFGRVGLERTDRGNVVSGNRVKVTLLDCWESLHSGRSGDPVQNSRGSGREKNHARKSKKDYLNCLLLDQRGQNPELA